MNKQEQKTEMEQDREPCVRVFIVGRSDCIEYDPNSNTQVVKGRLTNAFGRGLLKRRSNGRGVATETLPAGDYDYQITEQTPQQGK